LCGLQELRLLAKAEGETYDASESASGDEVESIGDTKDGERCVHSGKRCVDAFGTKLSSAKVLRSREAGACGMKLIVHEVVVFPARTRPKTAVLSDAEHEWDVFLASLVEKMAGCSGDVECASLVVDPPLAVCDQMGGEVGGPKGSDRPGGPGRLVSAAADGSEGQQAQMELVGPELAAPAVDDGGVGCIVQKDQVGPELATLSAVDGDGGLQAQKDQVGPAIDDALDVEGQSRRTRLSRTPVTPQRRRRGRSPPLVTPEKGRAAQVVLATTGGNPTGEPLGGAVDPAKHVFTEFFDLSPSRLPSVDSGLGAVGERLQQQVAGCKQGETLLHCPMLISLPNLCNGGTPCHSSAQGDTQPVGGDIDQQVAGLTVQDQECPASNAAHFSDSDARHGELATATECGCDNMPTAPLGLDSLVVLGAAADIHRRATLSTVDGNGGLQAQKDQVGPAIADGVEGLVLGDKSLRAGEELGDSDGQRTQRDQVDPELAAPAVADEGHGGCVQIDQVGPELATPIALVKGGDLQAQKDQAGPAAVFMRRDLAIHSAGEALGESDGQQAQEDLGGPELAAPAVADGGHGGLGLKDLVSPERPTPIAVDGGDGLQAQEDLVGPGLMTSDLDGARMTCADVQVKVPEVQTAEKTGAGEGPFELLSGAWLRSFVAQATSIEQVVRDLSRDLGVEYDSNEDCQEDWQRYVRVFRAYQSLADELSCLTAKTDKADVSTTRLALEHAQSCIIEARQARLPPPPPACVAGSGKAGKNRSKRRGRG